MKAAFEYFDELNVLIKSQVEVNSWVAINCFAGVKKLSFHQSGQKIGVDSQIDNLNIREDGRMNCLQIPFKKGRLDGSGSSHVDWLERKVVLDSSLLSGSGHHRSCPNQGHKVLWVTFAKI